MRLAVGLEFVELSEDLLAIPILDGTDCFRCVLKVNETARYLLQLLKNSVSEKEIFESMGRQFQISPEQAAKDVRPVLDRLLQRGVVET